MNGLSLREIRSAAARLVALRARDRLEAVFVAAVPHMKPEAQKQTLDSWSKQAQGEDDAPPQPAKKMRTPGELRAFLSQARPGRVVS